MDALQYLPVACEYSIWNATVSTLQFWMPDLEPLILSNVINQVYAAFFYSDYIKKYKMYQMIHSLVALWPPWIMLLKLSLHRMIKVMRVKVKASTSPPLSAVHHKYNISPWRRIYPSILWTLVNHQHLQSSMKTPHLADTDITVFHTTD